MSRIAEGNKMEDEMVLKQPNDRRLGENVNLPPGPPGAEFDTPDFGK